MKSALGLVGLLVAPAISAPTMRAPREVAAPASSAPVQAFERQLQGVLETGAAARASASDR